MKSEGPLHSGTQLVSALPCPNRDGTPFAVLTAEERAVIQQSLNEHGAPAAEVGRTAALARAALKFAGMLLLGAGVVNGYADGNEFDDVGCSVAQQPGGAAHGARSAQSGERGGGKLPGTEGGSAGGAGVGGGAGPPQCGVRAAECPDRMADGECRILEVRCRWVEGLGAVAENRTIAVKIFELLTALDPDNRLRKAPPIKVFNLYYRQRLEPAEIARTCKCHRSLIFVRLTAIQEKLPWTPQQLHDLSPQVEAMHDALTDSRAGSIYRKGAVYGDEADCGDVC